MTDLPVDSAHLDGVTPVTLGWHELADWLAAGRLGLGPDGAPEVPLVFVDLDAAAARPGPPGPSVLAGLASAVAASHQVMVGVTERGVPDRLAPLASALECTLAAGPAMT